MRHAVDGPIPRKVEEVLHSDALMSMTIAIAACLDRIPPTPYAKGYFDRSLEPECQRFDVPAGSEPSMSVCGPTQNPERRMELIVAGPIPGTLSRSPIS